MAQRFSRSITQFVQKTGIRADRVFQAVVFEAYKLVLLNSAVDTTKFRGNHNIGSPDADTTTSREPRPRSLGTVHGSPMTSGEKQYARARIGPMRFGDTAHISNNLSYANSLENEGKSSQTPFGTYGPAFDQLLARLDATLRAGRAL